MAGVLEGMKDESGYKSFFEKAEDGCSRLSWKMNKKEGGESQLDVGGKNSHRLSPIYYTSIADIKGFRFRLEKTISTQRNHQENEISSPRRASTDPQRPFRRNQSPRSDGLTLPEARL
jgi:hypothetical protein